jgi:fluoride exporter
MMIAAACDSAKTWKRRAGWYSTAMLGKLAILALGGTLGTLSRYGVSLVAGRVVGGTFPLGTLVVNLTGCFLIGLAYALAEDRAVLGSAGRLFFMTGFLGALTTFSTFALETVAYGQAGTPAISALNLVANNIGGLLLVLLGMWVGRIV